MIGAMSPCCAQQGASEDSDTCNQSSLDLHIKYPSPDFALENSRDFLVPLTLGKWDNKVTASWCPEARGTGL